VNGGVYQAAQRPSCGDRPGFPTEARGLGYLQDNVREFRRKIHITGAAYLPGPLSEGQRELVIKDIGTSAFTRSSSRSNARQTSPLALAQHPKKLPPGELVAYKKE
jgi:hypothetical protein